MILAFAGRRFENESHRVAIGTIGLSFFLSLVVLVEVGTQGPIRLYLYPFIRAGNLVIDVGLYADALAVLLLVLVTGVSSVVQVFSSRYMQGDSRYRRFFAVSCLFTFSMLMLVLTTNFAMLYLFWEVMGICSYLLISHYSERPAAAASATRVFLVNAVADMSLGLGVFLTFATFGTLDIQEVLRLAPEFTGETMNLLPGWSGFEFRIRTLSVITLLFFIGAMGKSAQFPLHFWLPYAMEAPTPVSALIHAATLVKAGIFLMIRLSPLFVLSPSVMVFATGIGMLTALLGATAAVTQSDIKKILAYSTMSQLGLMVMACGLGAFRAATFHLLAHGAVKAYLFLGSGGALQSLGAPQAHNRLQSVWNISIGVLVLAAMPPLLMTWSGYGQLWFTGESGGAAFFFWMIVLGTSFLTGLYLTRGLKSHTDHSGLIPVVSAVFLATAGLLLVLPWGWNLFTLFLGSSVAQAPGPVTMGAGSGILMILGFLAAYLGIGFGVYRNSGKKIISVRWHRSRKKLYMVMRNKWYIDEVCDAFVLRPTLKMAQWLWKTVDVCIIDRAVLGFASRVVRFSKWLLSSVDHGILIRFVNGIGQMTFKTARWLWKSVDIRVLGGLVDGLARSTLRTAHWLLKGADIRGLESFLGRIGDRNDASSRALRQVEPSLLQHQLLVMIYFLLLALIVFLIFGL